MGLLDHECKEERGREGGRGEGGAKKTWHHYQAHAHYPSSWEGEARGLLKVGLGHKHKQHEANMAD